jgi:hypothetical protein
MDTQTDGMGFMKHAVEMDSGAIGSFIKRLVQPFESCWREGYTDTGSMEIA